VDNALYWLDEVRKIRMPWYPWIVGWFRSFRPLHEHPRIIALAEELGVPLLSDPK